MGSFFNGGTHRKPRYERLPLDTFSRKDSTRTTRLDDDPDEENLLFDFGEGGSQNGRLLPPAKNGYDSEEEIEFYKDTHRSRYRQPRLSYSSSRCCLVCLLAALVIVVLLFSALYMMGPTTKSTTGWTSSTFEYATETAIRLYDVNQDGIQDVILGAATTSSLRDVKNEVEFCKKVNMTYPCAGLIMALDGRNGTRLWTIHTRVEVFAIQCGKLDINGDGHMDCIAAGRMGTLHGIDPINGSVLWSADPGVTNLHFNFFQGQVVPDLDQDGVPDYVVTHGGDTRFSDKELDRPAGRLLLLSGKTGRSLGRYLSLPDNHETYSAITLYTRPNGAIFLLFGSGGETISGSLWAISLRDLYCYVMSMPTCSADQLFHVSPLQKKGYDEHWGTPIQTLQSGAMEILRSGSSKGVTVPTELVDMNNDGVDDLVVFMYNSTIAILDGVNLGVIWSTGKRFAEFETYSNLAPGYFNDDDTIDLMVHLSEGKWPKFISSCVYILDGRDGKVLWSLKTPSFSPIMSSPLTLQSYGRKDAFLFWVQGLDAKIGDAEGPELPQPAGHGMGPDETGDGSEESLASPGRPRRHGDEMVPEKLCLLSLDVLRADLLIVDRNLALEPLRLASADAFKYNYTLTEEDRLMMEEDLYHHGKPGAVETVPPDMHGILSSQSPPTTTKTNTHSAVTEEDLARHNLHRYSTTPGGAVTTPKSLRLRTDAVTKPEGLETTTDAITTPEGEESVTVMSTSEVLEVTTFPKYDKDAVFETSTPAPTYSVSDVETMSTVQPTTSIGDTKPSTVQPKDNDRSTSTEYITPMSANSERAPHRTSETTAVDGVQSTFETTDTPTTESITIRPTDLLNLNARLKMTTESSDLTTGRESSTEEITTNQSKLDTGGMNTNRSVSRSSSSNAPSILPTVTEIATPPPDVISQDSGHDTQVGNRTNQPLVLDAGTPGSVTNVASSTAVESTAQHTTAQHPTSPEIMVTARPTTSSPIAINLPVNPSRNKSDADLEKMEVVPVNQNTTSKTETSHMQASKDANNDLVTNSTLPNIQITNEIQTFVDVTEYVTEPGTASTDQDTLPEQESQDMPYQTKGETTEAGKSRRRREIPTGDLCTVYIPSLLGTGVIGDLDNDGSLDYIYAETHMAQLMDEGLSYISSKLRLRVHRLVLDSAIKRQDWLRPAQAQPTLSEGLSSAEVDTDEVGEHFRFLPAEKQSWNSYMGKGADGQFKKSTR
ncbi:uncharacterized protein LOC110980291 [Acanthaster planci]|uniref:Uncharacterized protein LOC110980291 n=1 Tax=Acanthaster planci TaxID=133434 RepID=A0A8B7YJF8_ACAPL|nr:uncharacterized protein LOC110980291 [Acanthaster planci]